MFRSGRSHMLAACLIGAVCALSALAIPAAAQSQIGIQVISSQPSNFAGPAGDQATTFTMRPSVTSSTLAIPPPDQAVFAVGMYAELFFGVIHGSAMIRQSAVYHFRWD